jgi:hypothetical protein
MRKDSWGRLRNNVDQALLNLTIKVINVVRSEDLSLKIGMVLKKLTDA